MVLPTKHISLENCYLGAGMTVLKELEKPLTVEKLWKRVRDKQNIVTARRFYNTLDLLYILGLVDLEKDKICKV